MTKEKIIGILGGMGPLATVYYFDQLIQRSKAIIDQDYPRVIIDNHSQIPDRTKAILHSGPTPLDRMLESVQLFNHVKVTHAFVACFTAHHFIEELRQQANFTMLSVFEILDEYLQAHPEINKIGIIATSGAKRVGLFDRHLDRAIVLYPDDKHQTMIMDAIYHNEHGIKANKVTPTTISWIDQTATSLLDQGADVLIAGCTEIGLIMDRLDHKERWLDPMVLIVDRLLD